MNKIALVLIFVFFTSPLLVAQNEPASNENEQALAKDTIVKEDNSSFKYATYTPHTKHYFSLHVGAGLGSYFISGNNNNTPISSNLGVGQVFYFDYKYFFNRNWGLGLGVGISHLNSSITANSSFETQEDNNFDVDYSLFHHTLTNLKETQNVINLKVPLHANFRTRVNYQSSFHIGLGFAFTMPFYKNYKYKSGVYDVTRDEYLNGVCITSGAPFIAYGHEVDNIDVDKIMGVTRKEFYGKNGSFDLKKFGCDIFADLGFLYNPTRRFGVYFGLYAAYGILNSKKNNSNEFIFDIKKDTYYGAFHTNIVKTLHSIEAGAKIGVDFGIRTKSERDEIKFLEEESQRMIEEQQRISDSLQALLQSVREDYTKLDYIDSVTDFKPSLFISSQTDAKMLIYAIDNDSIFAIENEDNIESDAFSPSVAYFKQNVFNLGEERVQLQYVLEDPEIGYELTRPSKIKLRYFKSLLNARNTSLIRYALLDIKPVDDQGSLNREYINKCNALLNDFLDNGISTSQMEMILPQPGQKQEDSLNAICNVFDYGICSSLGSLAIYFDYNDQLIISDEANETLNKIVKTIQRNDNIYLNIVGNYSESNIYSSCYAKALRRALSFKKLLVEKGIDKHAINCYSRANKIKIATDKNNPYRIIMNNRIEIEVYRK